MITSFGTDLPIEGQANYRKYCAHTMKIVSSQNRTWILALKNIILIQNYKIHLLLLDPPPSIFDCPSYTRFN